MQKIDLQSIDPDSLKSMKVAELRDIAGKIGIPDPETIHKVQLRQLIIETVKEKKAAEEKKSREKNKSREKTKKRVKESSSRGETLSVNEKKSTAAAGEKRKPVRRSGVQRYSPFLQAGRDSDQGGEEAPDRESAVTIPPLPTDSRNEQYASQVQTVQIADLPLDENLPAEMMDPLLPGEPKYSPEERPQVEGILDIAEGGFGFLRFRNFLTSEQDIYVSQKQIRRFHLKTGDRIKGITRRPNEGERFGALLYVNTVNGDEPGVSIHRPNFEDLTPVFPRERIRLEGGGGDLPMRMIDLFAPIGKGQRGLIVAPPKTGKTVLLKQIAQSIESKYPEMCVMVLLIDERPEEVTDMMRSIKGEVVYSTFDEQAEHHVKVAEMVIAHAHRLAEHKKDVIILLDSITRLARAYNMVVPSSGKTLSGGIDPGALHKPKKFFGSARKLEEGGSITILATALIETGSRMDDVIFEEFKGTGNMELHLDRKLSERRIFPAVNIQKSGTRREDLLLDRDELEAVFKIRRALSNQGVQDVTEMIIDHIAHTKRNRDFINIVNKTKVFS